MSSKMAVKKEAIMARFGGMGFHNSEANVWREMDDVQFNQYVGKVYRELSPGFPECGEAFRNGRRKRWMRLQNIVKKCSVRLVQQSI